MAASTVTWLTLVMAKESEPDVPPPGDGVNTVTLAVPDVATFNSGTTAVSRVEVTNVVDRSEPFQRITEVTSKFEPFMVNTNEPLPAYADDGLIDPNDGDGRGIEA